MNDVYIRAEDLSRWIVRNLPQNRDLYSIDDLIGAIEDLDSEVERLKNIIDEMEERNNYPEEERDREIEVIE